MTLGVVRVRTCSQTIIVQERGLQEPMRPYKGGLAKRSLPWWASLETKVSGSMLELLYFWGAVKEERFEGRRMQDSPEAGQS